MSSEPESLKPILTAHLFPRLEGMLIDLLRSLGPGDWEKQTVAPRWKVKDVAAHLLDTALRGLSIGRDKYPPAPAGTSAAEDLAALVNRLNEEGLRVYRRLSANVLISLMAHASGQLCEYHASLDPSAEAPFGVSWAGEDRSPNWFSTAREFTERWHHQQQIRLAVDKPGIMTRELYQPVLNCFMRALPFAYRTVSRKPGTCARFTVPGECGGSWYLLRDTEAWRLVAAAVGEKASEKSSETIIPPEIAWRVFTKGIDRASAMVQVRVTGDEELGLHVLGMVTIVA
jgi:uncharacterized protein (TIGR03083 family)